MTLDALIGAQLIVGFPGTTLTPEVAAHLRAIHAGGFIPFARNFTSPEQFRALCAQLEAALPRPPLVMVDHEGGRVVRFTEGVTRFPDARTVGARQQPEAVAEQGTIEAKELRALGVDVNLAPCLDMLIEGADPVIGGRSYGSDPMRVAQMGAARIRGLQDGGVLACAKHFPGIGAIPRDPHKQLPTVDLDWDTMRTVHLPPFREAIRAQVACIMSSHVCYPQLDSARGLPATYSVRLMRELLRTELGFQGILLSDDLEMGAVRESGSIGEAAVRAKAAGHDALLVCSDVGKHRQVFQALRAAYGQGRLPLRELEEGVKRLDQARAGGPKRP